MSEYKLNKAQREAVEYSDGPLLIVAGAGTGKTTVIVGKIEHLIESGLSKPDEILALAFNEKAADEMKNRVDNLVALGDSEPKISTFHAFCQEILERHAIDIGLSNSFKMVTDTAAWLIIRENLDRLNLNYYRPAGSPMRHIYDLLQHFSKCKDELVSSADYIEFAESLSKDSGDMNIEEKDRLSELANAYHTYNQLLLDSARFDFGDLIYYTVRLFEARPSILQKFQKQYKYILVDEFQDVNWAQYKLITLLAGGKSQLSVVGDDDQSIYAFRGASVSNILRFQDDFPNAHKVVLNENYRSVQPILDVAYESIQNNNPDRLEVKLKIDKKLKSKSGTTTKNQSVVHIQADTLENEAEAVAHEILKIKDTNPKVSWDDFAILVRANNHAEPFVSALRTAKIPYEFLASSGLYRQPIVLDCINFFKIITNYTESWSIYRLLRLPFWKLSENDVHKIISTSKKKAITYYEALKRAAEFDVSREGIAVCEKLLTIIHNGMRSIKHEKPHAVLYAFLEQSGYLEHLAKGEDIGDEDSIRSIYHLRQFLNYIKEFEAVSDDAHVPAFLDHLTLVVDAGDKGALYQPSDTPDSVNILTVHASKGLEFRYVFMVNMVEERFPTRSKGEGIEIPAGLVKEQLPEGNSHYQEERRLFYVAVTRAKERLYFTSAYNYGGARIKKISRFLTEVGITAQKRDTSLSLLPQKNLVATKKEKAEFIYELPKAFSFSQIRSYETCPYQYKLAHILQLPPKGNAQFSFGTTIHNTLQAFYEKIRELNSAQQVSLFEPNMSTEGGTALATKTHVRAPSFEDLLAIYEEKWIGDWYPTPSQREEKFALGKKILKIFYAANEGSWTVPLYLESPFKIRIGDTYIRGRIDRIDKLEDNTLEIIDYKTGEAKEKLTSEDKEQLLIYQIAVQELSEYKNEGRPSRLTFYYVNNEIKTSFIGESEELDRLKQKLQGILHEIGEKNFTPDPSEFKCKRCDFKDICDYRI